MKAHQQQPQRRLARARYADDAESLALRKPERGGLHRLQLSFPEQPLAKIEAFRDLPCFEDDFVVLAPATHSLRRILGKRGRAKKILDHWKAQRPAPEGRPARQQLLRLGVPRRGKHLVDAALLADLSVAHY